MLNSTLEHLQKTTSRDAGWTDVVRAPAPAYGAVICFKFVLFSMTEILVAISR